ncbi:BMP family ABC transporter substrate-binding protein [Paraconexibacter antarcticus]|uniref:BMP family ABC transporter substrate-binding protein n=1 Tax=Paraconexibacter antarcticus TaxID=2949664 RepID=A0ABY5DUX6_9ACTN|nr:BMP family ABC transporter substrate-binding protein [Paraconexibacter antarcticus]UTI65811.1 BMP family ABC transporter substrate-binding protein [Paraconexibacter antarcticus]
MSLVAAGCGSSGNSSSTSTPAAAGSTSTAAAAPTGKKIKVGLVTDIGGLNDRSFNALANKGLGDAESQLGIDGRVLTSKSNADYVPNLSTLAQQKYDLVIGVGFLMADAMGKVAKKYPGTKFAIIDVDQTSLKGKPANVEGLLFKEEEGGYLAGYLAALYAKDHKMTTISSVGGQKIPPVDHYIAGYQAGAKAADPGIKTLNGYSQDFVDQSKCKELALGQIGQGSGIVFQVAGQCGLGALDAAKSKGKLGIGVDADQAYLGSHILTSATKKVDVAVFDTIKEVQAGGFKAGTNTTFDLKTNGVGIGKVSAAGTKYQAQIDKVAKDIVAGTITVPDTVK